MRALAQQGPVPAQAGIGLRFCHQAEAAQGEADAPWFEVHPENYTHDAGAHAALLGVRARRPLSLHAVGLSLGSAHGLDESHVARLKRLVQQLEPALVSDHLSWSAVPGIWLPDLLPLPYTDEALAVMCRNVAEVQQQLQRQILVENPSTYLQYADAALSEAQFLAELVSRTGCGVLLDVNNIYVSARNQHSDPRAALADMLRALPPLSIAELHLAGHATTIAPDHSELRIDDHGSRVCADVWQLYEQVLARIGARPTLIEWDTQIPAFAVLAGEAGAAQQRLDDVQHALAV